MWLGAAAVWVLCWCRVISGCWLFVGWLVRVGTPRAVQFCRTITKHGSTGTVLIVPSPQDTNPEYLTISSSPRT